MKDNFDPDWLNNYGAILFGLVIGAVAHFGRKLTDNENINAKAVLGFVMQLGVVGLIAAVATRELGVGDDDMRALATAVLALSTQEVIQAAKKRGWIGPFNAALPKGDDK